MCGRELDIMASLQELRETLSTSTSGMNSLLPKIIDRLLLEYVRKLAPLSYALPRRTWSTEQYIFNKRTAIPKAQATVEAPSSTAVAATNSTFAQVSFPIKHLQSQVDIGTFAAQVAMVNGNLFDLELAGAAKAMKWLEEILHLYGSAAGTANTSRPQWDGVDVLIASGNKIDAGTSLLSLSHLDQAMDAVRGVAAQYLGTDWFFLVSPKMSSRINGLFVNQQRFNEGMTKIFSRDDYGFPNSQVADNYIDGGVEVATYRGVPIVVSNFLTSQGSSAMGTVTATAGGSDGTGLSATTYYYVVEAVTRYGLMTASAEASATTTSNQHVALSWSMPTPTDAFGNTIDILGYRIFRGTASGAESLYAFVPAFDNNDAAVTSFTDTGVPSTASSLYATFATSSGNAAPDGATYPRVQTGSQIVEDVYLLPRDPEYIVCPVVNELQTQMLAPINARSRQFALTMDMTLAFRAGAFGAKISRVRAV
jgi:hypothetical protein